MDRRRIERWIGRRRIVEEEERWRRRRKEEAGRRADEVPQEGVDGFGDQEAVLRVGVPVHVPCR